MYCIFIETACIIISVHHHISVLLLYQKTFIRTSLSENRNEVLLLYVWNIFNKVIKVFHLDYADEANNVV